MSQLSKGVRGLANTVKREVLKPVAGAYNRNKSAILQAAALAALGATGGGLAAGLGAGGMTAAGGAGLGALGGVLSGGIQGSDADKARHEEQRQLNNRSGAVKQLGNILTDIGGNDPTFVRNQPPTVPTDPNIPQPTEQPTGGQPTMPPVQNNGTFNPNDPSTLNDLRNISAGAGGQAGTNFQQIIDATNAARQGNQSTLDSQAAMRQKQMQDLAGLLTEQSKNQYERNLPSLYEDLNTRGLLRSSDLGNQMSRRQQESYQDVANQLAQQQLGYNDQYISGMGDINNQYNAGVGSALQREFSLQDFVNQTNASLKLGQAVTPVSPSGKSNTAMASNGLGKAASGAQIASAFKK